MRMNNWERQFKLACNYKMWQRQLRFLHCLTINYSSAVWYFTAEINEIVVAFIVDTQILSEINHKTRNYIPIQLHLPQFLMILAFFHHFEISAIVWTNKTVT